MRRLLMIWDFGTLRGFIICVFHQDDADSQQVNDVRSGCQLQSQQSAWLCPSIRLCLLYRISFSPHLYLHGRMHLSLDRRTPLSSNRRKFFHVRWGFYSYWEPCYRQELITHPSLTATQHISRTTKSFNERRSAFSSEGGGKFEFRASAYLPTLCVFFWGGAINTEQRK